MLELNQLYLMDCMDGMRQFPDQYFDLAIVDPPYGINANKMTMGSNPRRRDGGASVGTARKLREQRRAAGEPPENWDSEPPGPEYFAELFRVSKNQIIWGGNYFPLPPTRGIIVWDKLQSWDAFSQVEIAWTSFDRPAALYRRSATGGRNDEEKIHPTQKPVALYEWTLQKCAKPGDKILDTHVGSGSSLIACHRLGFEFIGFEIGPRHYRAASERLEAERAQTRLEGIG